MNRRQFFGSTFGAALVALMPWKRTVGPVPDDVLWLNSGGGLAALVAETPTTSTVGCIDKATFLFWSHRAETE